MGREYSALKQKRHEFQTFYLGEPKKYGSRIRGFHLFQCDPMVRMATMKQIDEPNPRFM